MERGEFVEPRHQPLMPSAGGIGDLEIAAGRSRLSVSLARRLQLHEHVMRGAEQQVALFGEDQSAGMAVEQRDRKLLLQRADRRDTADCDRPSCSPACVKLPPAAA
jgi:hypothetical protein